MRRWRSACILVLSGLMALVLCAPAATADKICYGSGKNIKCVEVSGGVGPASPGVQAGTEWADPLECGPRRKDFSDALKAGNTDCFNALGTFCPLGAGKAEDPTREVIVYAIYKTGTTDPLIRTDVACDVPVGAKMPTMGQIRDEVTRQSPEPAALAGGTDYLVNAAVVFYARAKRPAKLVTSVDIPQFPLAGHKLTAHLELTKAVWSWGDGSPEATIEAPGDMVGDPFDEKYQPCEAYDKCSKYVSHAFTRPGKFTVSVHLYWDATVTIDGSPNPIPVTNGVNHADNLGKAVTLREARSVLVGTPP
jgi:hypothetical protein